MYVNGKNQIFCLKEEMDYLKNVHFWISQKILSMLRKEEMFKWAFMNIIIVDILRILVFK